MTILESHYNGMAREIIAWRLLAPVVIGIVLWNVIALDSRIASLEKQVNTLGIAVKAAHGEAKQAQRTQGPYLPDPMKVVVK